MLYLKTLFIFSGISTYLLCQDVVNVQAAPLKCSESKTTIELPNNGSDVNEDTNSNNNREENINSLNKIFHNIQCTLEKAKPWVAELQQEAKRLEEAAKLLGLGILNSFGEFVDKLVEETAEKPTKLQNNTALNANENSANATESITEAISEYLCPEGFVADLNGICERINLNNLK